LVTSVEHLLYGGSTVEPATNVYVRKVKEGGASSGSSEIKASSESKGSSEPGRKSRKKK
jgi:hypothetical protein